MDFIQGKFDNLCGIYAAINATIMALEGKIPKTKFKKSNGHRNNWQEELFERIIVHIDAQGPGCLRLYIINGTTIDQLYDIIGVCRAFVKETTEKRLIMYRRSMAKTAKKIETLDDYWKWLSRICNEDRHTGIIVGFERYMDHWACVAAIRPQFLYISERRFDNRIDRANCTIAQSSNLRPLTINVRETVRLRALPKR